MNPISEEIDHFDRLPDPIVLSIFNKVHDAKSLCSSMAVCKRFNSVIPEVDSVLLSIPRRNPSKKCLAQKKSFKNFISRALVKPLNFLLHFLKSKSSSCDSDDGYSYYMPHEVLKPFKDVKSMEINLPKSSCEMSSDLLKWKAEFGSQIQSCVLLGAKSISRNQKNCIRGDDSDQNCIRGDDCDQISQPSERSQNQDSRISDDELKLRIVWTISCLIAASARHYLIQQTLNDLEKLEKLIIVDESNQGTLSMNSEQIEASRKSMKSGIKNEEMSLDRTKVPALRMKMWYVPELKLPESDSVMKGATLVVIRPVDGGKKKVEESEESVVEAFDGDREEGKIFVEAMRKLMKKKRSYTLEMNAF